MEGKFLYTPNECMHESTPVGHEKSGGARSWRRAAYPHVLGVMNAGAK